MTQLWPMIKNLDNLYQGNYQAGDIGRVARGGGGYRNKDGSCHGRNRPHFLEKNGAGGGYRDKDGSCNGRNGPHFQNG